MTRLSLESSSSTLLAPDDGARPLERQHGDDAKPTYTQHTGDRTSSSTARMSRSRFLALGAVCTMSIGSHLCVLSHFLRNDR